MTKQTYTLIDQYMRTCMDDSVHDVEHIYRVLYNALQIAETEENVDLDVLIAACLLHDIGRPEQFADHSLCHAQVGAEKAERFLREVGFGEVFVQKVCHCIRTHRFRKNDPPQSVEAKILFDADKLDVTGALGIARSLMYKGEVTEPIYLTLPDGSISDGSDDASPSFFWEYKFKLERLYDRFFTAMGDEMARERREIAVAFYDALRREVTEGRAAGQTILNAWIGEKEIDKEDHHESF